MNIIDRLIIKIFMTPKTFSSYLIRADESNAFNTIAREAYGIDLGQFNMFTRNQLEALLIKLNSTDCVLDVGCGNGKISHYISNQTGCFIKGIDFATDAINKANEKYGNSNVSFDVHDIRMMDSIKEKYSKIISIDSLYFFHDLVPIFKSFVRLLAPGGQIILFFTCNLNYYGKDGFKLIEKSFSDLPVNINNKDFTEDAIEMWKKMKNELIKKKCDFIKEENKPLYNLKYSEAKSYLRMAEIGKIKRIMYVITLNEN